MTARHLVACAAAAGAIAVILGAFGAHALKARLTPEQLATFETGVRYQMYHALALLGCAALAAHSFRGTNAAGLLFIGGMLLFSGSIYLLATRELTGLTNWKWLGPVTPLGGLLLIAGWVTLLGSALRR
jgi:uncharacterized membrane protein YgdD (TMEM256/DUF423 family)